MCEIILHFLLIYFIQLSVASKKSKLLDKCFLKNSSRNARVVKTPLCIKKCKGKRRAHHYSSFIDMIVLFSALNYNIRIKLQFGPHSTCSYQDYTARAYCFHAN